MVIQLRITHLVVLLLMLKTTVNGKKEWLIEAMPDDWDIVPIHENTFHIIRNNQCYTATLISYNAEEKLMVVNINGNDYDVSIKDKQDLLLQKLGINASASKAVQHIKAPMPGLIVSIFVAVGSEVKKGDTLLILEAMKMENAIKSPRDGVLKKIAVEMKQAVEKNQLLLEFE